MHRIVYCSQDQKSRNLLYVIPSFALGKTNLTRVKCQPWQHIEHNGQLALVSRTEEHALLQTVDHVT